MLLLIWPLPLSVFFLMWLSSCDKYMLRPLIRPATTGPDVWMAMSSTHQDGVLDQLDVRRRVLKVGQIVISMDRTFSTRQIGGGGGVDPIPCVSTHTISDPRSGPAQLLPPHVKQRSHPHGVRPQIPDR